MSISRTMANDYFVHLYDVVVTLIENGYVVANSGGKEQTLSPDNIIRNGTIDQELADNICYAMGFS